MQRQWANNKDSSNRWKYIYFILAAVDILTVLCSLLLNDQMIRRYDATSKTNRYWVERLEELAAIQDYAQKVNAPGNDVFDSKDWATESEEMNAALKSFNQATVDFKNTLTKNETASTQILIPLLNPLDSAMNEMVKEANLIFEYFSQGKIDAAGSRMATMDNKYAQLNRAINKINSEILLLQQKYLDDQIAAAQNLKELELYFAILVLLMVVCIAYNGHKISKEIQLRQDTLDKQVIELTTLNDQLQKTQDYLIQSNKLESIGKLAGGIAHDFNNILASILGNIQLVQKKYSHDDYLSKKLSVVENAAIRGGELTKRILGFARKGQYELKNIEVKPIIQEAINMMNLCNDKITISTADDNEAHYIFGDPSQFIQVFMNLGVNATDAIEKEGTICFNIKSIKVDEGFIHTGYPQCTPKPGNYVQISISDSGSGISPEVLPKIFEPFFTTKEVGKGTGMGLAMVYGIIKKHEGELWVDSTPGKGSTFYLLIPESRNIENNMTVAQSSTLDKNTHHLLNKTILIVDDEPSIREILNDIVLEEGGNPIQASNGAEAIKIYKENINNIATILMDIRMPEIDGIETANEIKKINPSQKIIFVSGYSENNELIDIRGRYSLKLINKPFNRQEIIHHLLS